MEEHLAIYSLQMDAQAYVAVPYHAGRRVAVIDNTSQVCMREWPPQSNNTILYKSLTVPSTAEWHPDVPREGDRRAGHNTTRWSRDTGTCANRG
ncbi:hypothetical protein J6590_055039 [Homalodisca vitripennis]|nr:hypothetical protein J6590_055039 [Homalodisca vitripennis]